MVNLIGIEKERKKKEKRGGFELENFGPTAYMMNIIIRNSSIFNLLIMSIIILGFPIFILLYLSESLQYLIYIMVMGLGIESIISLMLKNKDKILLKLKNSIRMKKITRKIVKPLLETMIITIFTLLFLTVLGISLYNVLLNIILISIIIYTFNTVIKNKISNFKAYKVHHMMGLEKDKSQFV